VFGLDSSKICTHVRRCMSAWLGKRTTRKRIRLGGGGNNPGKHKPAGGGGGEGGEWVGGWTRGRQQTVGETQKKHDQRQQQKDDRGD